MKQAVKKSMELTTMHGLPRVVTEKPLYVRILWLLVFLLMLAFFLKDFYKLVVKLQSDQVTNTLEANSVTIQFPDIYACFENPISCSYSANVDAKSAAAINAQINAIRDVVLRELSEPGLGKLPELPVSLIALVIPLSMQYSLLIDALAHRKEQSVLRSQIIGMQETGVPFIFTLEPTVIYHPLHLSCFKWNISDSWQSQIFRPATPSGLFVTLNLDTNFTGMPSTGAKIIQAFNSTLGSIPVSDWSMSLTDNFTPGKRSGVRVYLTPPGEYPSDFVTSFSLSPGKHHTVEISMTQQVYKEGQFDCVSDAPDVQFVNPYDQTPYNQSYSYSYCYYYEYHKQIQSLLNTSGINGPLPWPLRDKQFAVNITGDTAFFKYFRDKSIQEKASQIGQKIKAACEGKRPCNRVEYSVSISSTDWPTESSLAQLIGQSVSEAYWKAGNKSVPGLDFLRTANASTQASYVRSNLLQVHFKPHKIECDQVTFSKDYKLENFVSDIGGIMGIYLGMSLLTLCEFLELIYDLITKKKCHVENRVNEI